MSGKGDIVLDLDMRQLEYFTTAARAGSYSRAAKQLFVSPQAISKGVQILETRFGVVLFERGPNGITLTPFGERFYQEAVAVLDSFERLQSMAKRQYLSDITSFSIGIHSLCFKEHGGSIDWNELLQFYEENKGTSPTFLEMRGDSISASVESGDIDFGIGVPTSKGFDSFEGTLLKCFPLSALVSCEDVSFANSEAITLEELSHGQIVLFSEEVAFNDFFFEKAANEGLDIDVSPLQIRTDSDLDFIINKKLYAVRPYQHATRTTKGDRIRILPILDNTASTIDMPLYIFWKKGKKLTSLERSFVNMIINLYR